MDVWIGTCGYSFPDWVGEFYPAGTRPERMLGHYCQSFPLVELNFTFYRPPSREVLERLADKTPAGFQFLVKLPRTVSHERSPRDLPGFRHAVEGLARRHQLAGLLCQLPQSAHNTAEVRGWLRTLAGELGDLRLAVEFRHRSWARGGLPDWMARHGLDLVAVDAPDLPGLFPRGWVQSSPRAYVRLHSRNSGNWYLSDKERYDYHYGDDQLGEWVEGAQTHGAIGGTERALFLFNNCHRGQAAANARRMRTLFEQQAPDVNVVAPFVAPEPVQRTLFE
jgi:uncharacterized protein YecE (DUF72 family)